jgi:Cu+-exporting ATPase
MEDVMTKKTLQLSGLHCTSCSLMIEGELEDMGVTARVNYAKQMADVEYDESVMDEKKIVGAIEKLGYKVV